MRKKDKRKVITIRLKDKGYKGQHLTNDEIVKQIELFSYPIGMKVQDVKVVNGRKN